MDALEALAAMGTARDPDEALEAFRIAVADASTRSRALPRAVSVSRLLRLAQRWDEAADVLSLARAASQGPALVARVRAEEATLALDRGVMPDDVPAVAAALLTVADERLAAGEPAAAAGWLKDALDLALHRTIHADDLVSPLGTDAAGWLAPFAASQTYRALRPSRLAGARRGGRPPRGGPRRSPHPVVALSTTGLHFLDLPLERLTSQGVRVTRLDLRTPATDVRLPNLASLTRARLVRAAGGEVEPSWLSPPSATPALEALGTAAAAGGTVFSEWCDRASVWASLVVPPGARLVIRLHSIEALSVAAHLVDWARVDQLVCVSEPLRRLTNEVVPMTRSVPTSVVPNAVSLQRMRGEKPPAADRTLVMVGWAQAVKDPLFALDVLGLLRGHDASWRLMLVGHPFPAKDRARSMAYAAAYEKRRAAADVAGAVDEVPFTDDLPAVLSKAGFVLSVSLRESSAVGLLEAVASGCVPVVRDWPIVSVYGGPGALFPAEWVVRTPQEAAARIGRHADPAARAAAARAAEEEVLVRYDWSCVAPQYDALLRG